MLSSNLVILLHWWGINLDSLCFDNGTDLCNVSISSSSKLYCTYSLLVLGKVSLAEGICLCNDWDQVDSGAKSLHNLNIQWLQGVSRGSDEIQAGVYAEIDLVCAARLLFLQHVRLVLIVQEFNDGHPGITVVHIVTETRRVNDGKADCGVLASHQGEGTCGMCCTFEELLLQLSLCNLNLHSLVDLLRMSSSVIGVVLDGGREKCVDEGSLSESRLTGNLGLLARCACTLSSEESYHNSKGCTSLCNNLVTLVGLG